MKENKMETTNLTEMERLIQAGEVFKAEAEETFEPGKIPEEIIKAIQDGKAGGSNELSVWKGSSTITLTRGGTKVGTLSPGEMCTFMPSYGGDYIYRYVKFRNANGVMTIGEFMDTNDKLKGVGNYPYGTVTIGGTKYLTFKFRRNENVRNSGGDHWGTVASGMRVAVPYANKHTAGEKYADHKLCSYVESTSGAWVKVGSYGFVNSGFLKGSMPNTVSMYGTF